MSRRSPSISVIMPVWNGSAVLHRSVGSLLRSDLPRDEWELIIADDGSSDGSETLAESWADQVVRVPDGPRGPGFARNLAASAATGVILVFLDADVCIHAGSLARFKEAFRRDLNVGAVFGAYDAFPAERDFLSQYRNLYHRFVHLQGAGQTETFWAGCGAVRRDLFLQLGGFDCDSYQRPQIEDIELGYRIRTAGYQILLDPEIQGSHLKKWTLTGIVKTDLLDRGIPWMRLLLGARGHGARSPTLNVTKLEKVKVVLTGGACLMILAGGLFRAPIWALSSLAVLSAVVVLNYPAYSWFAAIRGWGFAIRAIPLTLLYYLVGGLSAAIALVLHVAARFRRLVGHPAEAGAAQS